MFGNWFLNRYIRLTNPHHRKAPDVSGKLKKKTEMEYIDTTKSVLENLYYLSGILILISIAIGLFQLSIAKTTLNINSQREAAKLAVNQIDIYMTQIIPLQNKLYQTEKEKNMNFTENK